MSTFRARLLFRSALICLTATCCTSLRRAPRTTLLASGEFRKATDRSFGCGGEVLDRQRQHFAGGSVEVRQRTADGAELRAHAGLEQAQLVSYAGFEPETTEYLLYNGGGALALDGSHIGVLAGGDFWVSSEDALFVPRLELRAGNIDSVWLEVGTGQLDGSFDWRAFYAGGRIRHDWLSFNIGVASIGSPIAYLQPDEYGRVVVASRDQGWQIGPYGSVGFEVYDGVLVHAAAAGWNNYNARLMLEIQLDNGPAPDAQ